MIHYGDITKINGADVPVVDCVIGGSPCQDLSVAGKREGLDGERSGLFMEQIRIIKEMREKDAKSGRTGELLRPRFMVWENVPGAFSSNKGEDFRIVLEETAKIIDKDAVIPMPQKNKWTTSGCIMGDGWSIAWRVLDAQFWGVPQRRRRIALVADFGGGCAPEILFERKGLRGDFAESGTQRQRTAGSIANCFGETSICLNDQGGNCMYVTEDMTATLRAEAHHPPCILEFAGFCNGVITFEPGIASREGGHIYEDVSGTLRANAGDNQMAVCYDIGDRRRNPNEYVDVAPNLLGQMGTGGNNVPVVVEGLDCYNQSLTGDKSHCLRSKNSDTDHIPCVVMDRSAYNQGINAKFDIGVDENGVAFSHIAKGPGAVCYIDTSHLTMGNEKAQTLRARDYKEPLAVCYVVDQGGGKSGANVTENVTPTLTCTHYTLNTIDRPAVAYGINGDVAGTLDASYYKGCCMREGKEREIVYGYKESHYIVRRLTPLDCERLQGFKDGWTDIGEYTDSNGKRRKTADTARYKALGNSIALPPWKWIVKRLCSHYERDATMASLFDGIGGFPCIWEQINGKGTALWASEIEEFPIAVTKVQIG